MGRSDPKPRYAGRRVAGLMRRHFIAVDPGASLREVYELMRFARVRQLPVARDGLLLGVVSFRDVLRAWALALAGSNGRVADRMRQTPVDRVMTPSPGSVSPRSTLRETARVLCRIQTGCVPVVEPGDGGARIVGLVTESDLLRAAFEAAS